MRAGDRALLRAAHVLPGDRRPGVQDAALTAGEPRHGVARQHQIDQPRLGREVAFVGGAVGLLDATVADHAGERPAKRRIGAGGRRPAQVRDVAAGGVDVVRKALQTDVDDLEVLLKQGLHDLVLWRSEIRAADQVAASALDEATSTPADLRPATILLRFCGS